MPTIRNITQKELVIAGKFLQPYKTMEISTSELLNLHSMINHNMIVVENFNPSAKQEEIVQTQSIENKMEEVDMQKFSELKENLLDAFFAFYLEKELSSEQLETLKWFYSNVGPTSSISLKTKTLLNDITNAEELIEILLNHIYPELIKNQLRKN